MSSLKLITTLEFFFFTFDLEEWSWPWLFTTQNVQLHEIHMHAKYEVTIFNIAKVMAKFLSLTQKKTTNKQTNIQGKNNNINTSNFLLCPTKQDDSSVLNNLLLLTDTCIYKQHSWKKKFLEMKRRKYHATHHVKICL